MELAQAEAMRVYENQQRSHFFTLNGVTEITVTAEDVQFVRGNELMYDQEDHYLVVLRVDCRATGIPRNEEYALSNHLGRLLPQTFGEIDGYPVKLRVESTLANTEIFGKDDHWYDGKKMVYIYINGELEGEPFYYN